MRSDSKTVSCLSKAKLLTFLAACVIVVSALALPSRTQAGTSYQEQIAGFLGATLGTIIAGEFVGRDLPNVLAQPGARNCLPEDYERLRSIQSKVDFEAFILSCFLVEIKFDGAVVRAAARLPVGYCELLKAEYQKMLERQVYTKTDSIYVTYEYKGAHYRSSKLNLARTTAFDLVCSADASLHISAKRARR